MRPAYNSTKLYAAGGLQLQKDLFTDVAILEQPTQVWPSPMSCRRRVSASEKEAARLAPSGPVLLPSPGEINIIGTLAQTPCADKSRQYSSCTSLSSYTSWP